MNSMVTMTGTVIQAEGSQVLVQDNSTGQEVLVNTSYSTSNLSAGFLVRVEYDGAMTNSIPPQISADSICIIRERGR